MERVDNHTALADNTVSYTSAVVLSSVPSASIVLCMPLDEHVSVDSEAALAPCTYLCDNGRFKNTTTLASADMPPVCDVSTSAIVD